MKKLLIFIVAIIGVFYIIGKCSPEYKPDPEFSAYYYSKQFVTTILKTPSVAKFCEKEDCAIKLEADGYRVIGWVDSQNSFGAMMRSDFEVKVHESGSNWLCDELTFAGTKYK